MTRPKLHVLLLLGAILAAAIGQGALYWWYVEDSAISMAFARNLAQGWGLVQLPGGARIEGYSNPLWVAYMALGYLVGVDGFMSTKIAAGLLGCLVTVPVTYLLALRAKIPTGWAYAAAWVLAVDAQFIIWSACGLENGLFCALLALACWQTLREAEKGGFPWAAVCFLGLSLTRPEGILYAAFGGFMALVLEAAGNRRWGRIAAWLAVFWIPFAVYHAVRFQYFAFEFPATYYSKLEDARFMPWRWHGRGWKYFRGYALESGRGFMFPVLLAGLLSLRGWRGVTVVGFSLWLAALLLYPGADWMYALGWPRSHVWDTWVVLRIVSLGMVAVAVPFLAVGSEGWRSRVLLWGMGLLAIGFCLRSTGDWMRGYRWMSLAAVPGAVLLGLGCGEVAAWFQRRGPRPAWRWVGYVVGGLLFLGATVPEIVYQVRYQPEVGPFAMKRRLDHYAWAMRKVHLEKAHIIDHDMGAMMYWGNDLGHIRDSKGLIDYPFALHHASPRFVEEYVFDENPFDFCHGHASTGRAVRRVRRRFDRDYIEIPGYGGGQKLHLGNFARKSLLIDQEWTRPADRTARFEDGVELHGLHFPAPEVHPGSYLFVELGLSTRPRPDAPIRVLLVLTREDGDGQVALDLPLGLDDWYPVTEWKKGEIFHGRITVPIGPRLPHGTYSASLVVLGPDGVLPALEASDAGSLEHEPHYAQGEVTFPGAVRLLPPKKVHARARADLDRAVTLGNRLQCENAEGAWQDARAHFMLSANWQASVRPRVQHAIANCWAVKAEKSGSRGDAVHAIRQARWWEPTHPTVMRVGSVLADRWIALGAERREQGRIDAAYKAYRDALWADPSRSWARRYAEELRAQRLSLK